MRCYNGCPDSQLQAFLDSQTALHKELAGMGLRATYFPAEEKWMVFDKNHRSVTEFASSLDEAVRKVVQRASIA